MPGPGEVFAAACPSRVVLDHVTSKWGVLVLVALADGPQRWSELRRRAEGISEKMLAQTLRTLEADGLVHRDAQPVIPPRVDYSLTDRGAELVALLLPLFGWVVANADEIVGSASWPPDPAPRRIGMPVRLGAPSTAPAARLAGVGGSWWGCAQPPRNDAGWWRKVSACDLTPSEPDDSTSPARAGPSRSGGSSWRPRSRVR